MTEREARIAFNLIPDIGAVRVAQLAAAADGDVAAAYEAYPDKRDFFGRIPDWEGELARAEKMHVTILTECDDAYPANLRDLSSPPLALYVVGDPAALSRRGVALVGTRWATSYGISTAQTIARALAEGGWNVISGLARGIDAAAHSGALLGKGVTTGILGGALDRFFPPENRDLAHRIVDAGGAVASEFAFGREPDRQTFPQRNRIVAALADGVVAIEAPLKSGTLITCSRALELGRTVMAVPGRVDSRTSAGCHQLIRDGARLVTTAAEIAREILPLTTAARASVARNAKANRDTQSDPTPAKPTTKRPSPPPEDKVTLEESLVLRAVKEEGTPMDRIVAESGLPPGKVTSLLAALRLKGRIRFLPGNRACRA